MKLSYYNFNLVFIPIKNHFVVLDGDRAADRFSRCRWYMIEEDFIKAPIVHTID